MGVALRELFLPLLGNWTGIERQAASPIGPGTTARAMIVFKLDVSDQVVVRIIGGRADHAEFSGHGVFMSDRAHGMLWLHDAHPWWFFDTGLSTADGAWRWHDAELILEKAHRGIAEHRLRSPMSAQLSNSPATRFKPPSGQTLSGTYRRFSGHGSRGEVPRAP